jgi:N-formylmaleamate deformylase
MKQKKNRILSNFLLGIFGWIVLTGQPFTQSACAQALHPGYSFAVEKSGQGRAMILISGLYCSGEVWQETVSHFKSHYTCYQITLPGFAGQPPIQSDSLIRSLAIELAAFIQDKKLYKPIIVGHSLGGVIALQIAVLYPGLPGDLVVVSSAPFLPALFMSADVPLDSSRKTGLMIKKSLEKLTPAQIAQYQKFSLPTMIRDTAKISLVSEMAVRSDPATQGEMMYELFSMDLRADMKKINCPILLLGDWSSYRKYGATRQSTYQRYADQFSLAKNVTIQLNDSSRHFIMYDEPAWFYQELDVFLQTK